MQVYNSKIDVLLAGHLVRDRLPFVCQNHDIFV